MSESEQRLDILLLCPTVTDEDALLVFYRETVLVVCVKGMTRFTRLAKGSSTQDLRLKNI